MVFGAEYLGSFLLGGATLYCLGQLMSFRRTRIARPSDQAADLQTAALIDSLDGIVWERDARTLAFTFLSRQCETLLGIHPVDWIAQPGRWVKALHPDDDAPAQLRKLVDTGEPYVLEYRLLMADGRAVWFAESGAPVRDETDRVIGVRGMLRNITARKDAETQQEKLNDDMARDRVWLESILNSIPAVVFENWWSRETGSITPGEARRGSHFVNDSVVRVHGFSKEEWTSAPDFWFNQVHPDDREIAAKSAPALFGDNETRCSVYRWLRKDGAIVWGETYLSPLRDLGGKLQGIRGITLDVTKRVEAELAAAEANRQLVHASRQAGMAEVATSVLHNVGNALNSVNVSVGLVMEKSSRLRIGALQRVVETLDEHGQDLGTYITSSQGSKLPAFLAQLSEHFAAEQKLIRIELDYLRGNVEHINDIVSMQQNYATGGGMVEVLPVGSVIDDALRMNTSALQRHGSRVVTDFDTSIPPLPLDRNKVLLILMNLIRNAKYACEDGLSEDRCITLRTVRDGQDSIQISVSDNGIGIPPNNLSRIFEYGFTTRKGGHGFGLHSSALAAREMGGLLQAHSDGPGLGATFRLQLPFQPTAS